MKLRDAPIQRKLMIIVMWTTAVALVVTCAAFFAYELVTYRDAAIRHLETLGQVTADNSTAALAFDNRDDAAEVLTSLRAQRHLVGAVLFDADGKIFSRYPKTLDGTHVPDEIGPTGFRMADGYLTGFVPAIQGEERRLGTLFLKVDTGEIQERLQLYAIIALVVLAVSLTVAYLMSNVLQRQISHPLLSLATVARSISEERDYSMRMPAGGNDELGALNRAFNHMLNEIEQHVTEAEHAARTINSKNRELESLMYVVSHDLREPLRTIQNFSELVSDDYADRLDDEGQHLLRRIRLASERLEQLLLDLLDVSRASRTTKPTELVWGRELVDAALERAAVRLKESGGTVTVADDLPQLYVDKTWAIEAILNLLTNAMKYTKPGEKPEIQVSARTADNVPGISVADRGPGVPEGQHERVFELFQRAVGREIEGTGAGLSIVREVAEKHGGKAWVEDRDGGGAEFVITFGPVPDKQNTES